MNTPPRKPNPLTRLGKPSRPEPIVPNYEPKAMGGVPIMHSPPPKPERRPAPPVEVKSDPFPAEEPITENQNPAARAARLIARWNGLSPDRKKLAEQYVAALETTQAREKLR